jgi:hypothetical protein
VAPVARCDGRLNRVVHACPSECPFVWEGISLPTPNCRFRSRFRTTCRSERWKPWKIVARKMHSKSDDPGCRAGVTC